MYYIYFHSVSEFIEVLCIPTDELLNKLNGKHIYISIFFKNFQRKIEILSNLIYLNYNSRGWWAVFVHQSIHIHCQVKLWFDLLDNAVMVTYI